MDPPVPVPAMVRFEHLRDRRFELLLRVGRLEPGLVMEERGPGQPGDVQQDTKRMVSLEGDDGLNLIGRINLLPGSPN
jgi:hypothetical protein